MRCKMDSCVEKVENHCFRITTYTKTSTMKTASHLKKQSNLESVYLQDQKRKPTTEKSKKRQQLQRDVL